VALTPSLLSPTQPAASEPHLDAHALELAPARSALLWRFALVGLSPLTALFIFALAVALFQRLA
jgi:hypothetical protein